MTVSWIYVCVQTHQIVYVKYEHFLHTISTLIKLENFFKKIYKCPFFFFFFNDKNTNGVYLGYQHI